MADSGQLSREERISAIEGLVGYQFLSHPLLVQALTHSSYSNEFNGVERGDLAPAPSTIDPISDNERLEFLGDAVIGLVVAKELMSLFPNASEGKLSRWRSSLVSRKTLAEIAVKLGLGDLVLLGRGEKRTGGAEKRSILAAVLEAVVGALYLDGGLEVVSRFLVKTYEPFFCLIGDTETDVLKLLDKKTHLQERTQSLYKAAPQYRMVESWGPEHAKSFRVEILIAGEVVAQGDGRSKKDAEQQAASLALEILGF